MLGAVKDDIVNMRAQEFENFLQHRKMLRLDLIQFFNEPPLEPSNIIERVFGPKLYFSSIMNYHFLNLVVDICGSPRTKHDMMKFVQDIKQFMQRTSLKDSGYFNEEVRNIRGLTLLVIRHRLESDAPLNYLDEFRHTFCEAFKISEVSMLFTSAKLEETVWFVPLYLEEQLISAIKTNESHFNSLRITSLQLGEFEYTASDSKV